MTWSDEAIKAEARAQLAQKVAQARAMSFTERFFAGAELFDLAVMSVTAGVKLQFPSHSDEALAQVVKERVAQM